MTWPTVRKSVAFLAIVAIAVVVAFIAMSRGAATGPTAPARAGGATGTAGATSGPAPAVGGTEQAPKALVERMIDGLASGKKVKSFDNPVSGTVVPVVESGTTVPVGRLSIGRMNLRTPFYEGVHDEVIDRGPGHWPGTPLPGQPGNAVVSGHRATHGAEFVDLDLLQSGDEIDVQVGGSKQPLSYSVQGTTIVSAKRYVPFVLRQPEDPDERALTLFACNPKWDSTQRIVVRAVATPSSAVKGG